MSRLVARSGSPLNGVTQVPGDKSISHRAILLGAIAEGTTRIDNFVAGGDCRATLEAVRVLGIEVEEHSPEFLTVHGRGLRGLQEPESVLDCVRSGTTMRLLAGILAGQPFTSVLSGAGQLLQRPMWRIVEPLRRMGATLLGRQNGRLPPLTIRGGDLRGIDYDLPVASAQLKSALLLAGLYAGEPTCLREPGPARDHTERMLAAMGARLKRGEALASAITLEPGTALRAIDIQVPGDFSSAAFLLVAAALVPGSEITIEGVGINPTRTGLLEILNEMGANVTPVNRRTLGGEPVADLHVQGSELQAVEVRGPAVVRSIDELPLLAVAASQADGETVLHDAAELRVKETDRIATTVAELRKLGAQIEARPDGFVVRGPTQLRAPTTVRSHGDHRLAMSLAVAGLVAGGQVDIENADCVADSFPGFASTFHTLRANIALQ